jgi:Rap1a immunity proteins
MRVVMMVLGIIVLASSHGAVAQPKKDPFAVAKGFTARDIAEGCRSIEADENDFDVNLRGVECVIMLGTLAPLASHLQENMRSCPPSTKDGLLLASRAFQTYVKKHPEREHQLPLLLAIDALRAAWPCPK